jgi:hypothetical protein
MSYIIIYNTTSRDPIVDTNYHGFIETYASAEDAAEAAEENLDGKDYRSYTIYEEIDTPNN